MTSLTLLLADIDTRVNIIRSAHPDWLCGKGCDACCRRLADVPQLTNAEWELLQEGLVELSQERLLEIGQRMTELAGQTLRPVICPLLDPLTGSCLVYLQRPVACRTYGFYVQRHLGLYCHDIESRVAENALADVVWGNHDAIDQKIAHLGDIRPLTTWFAFLAMPPQRE